MAKQKAIKRTTRDKIIQAAIECLAQDGLEQTTFQAIADRAGVSQPLVVYHLKSRQNIFYVVINHIMDAALVETQNALRSSSHPEDQIREYLKVSLKIFRTRSDISKIYMAFFYLSSFDPSYRQLNDQLKLEAVNRLIDILAAGVSRGIFKLSNLTLTAKIIHTNLTGLLLNLATETSHFSDEALLSELVQSVMALVTSESQGSA